MLSHETDVEDSECLLSVLNRATAKLMSMSIAMLGTRGWKLAHRDQQLAFDRWFDYISKDRVFEPNDGKNGGKGSPLACTSHCSAEQRSHQQCLERSD
jgi:hypothetical protein